MKIHALQASVGLSLLTLLACSSNAGGSPTAAAGPADFPPAASTNSAQFSPSAGIIPLPNVLLTAAVTTPVVPAAGVPLAPDKAMAWINQNEVGNTNAVAGLSSPIKVTFDAPVTAPAGSIKVFMCLPDSDGTENGKLGFRDVTALFSTETSFTWYDRATPGDANSTKVPTTPTLANPFGVAGAAVQLSPRIPLPAGSRFVYVITDGVKDTASGLPVRSALIFNYLKYQKPLTDLTDPANPAAWLGASTTGDLEKIRGNAMSGSNIALSGYAKTMADLVASASADASGKAAAGAGATGIASMDNIRLIGRFITSGSVATRLILDSAATQVPVEVALWAWANNAPAPNFPFGAAPARQWNNGVSVGAMGQGQFLGSTLVNAFWSQLPAPLSQAPHAAVGYIALGTFQSGDLNIDPAVVAAQASKPADGKMDGVTGAYNPGYYPSGAAPVPGTGVLQGARPDGKTLTGFYHVTRNVPFLFVAPITAPPSGGYPVMLYQHGITSQKEDILAAANTICAAGYAVLAIDAPLHGGLANGRAASEWGANFMSLLSILNTRTNVQQGGFNLWRAERILKQPTADPTSLQSVAAAVGKNIAATGASRFLGHSLGTIIGSYFLAGNSSQTGGSNINAFLSAPGARVAYVIRESQAGFAYSANIGLKASGVAPGSHSYDQFMMLVQSIVDPVDPSWALSPIKNQPNGLPFPSRLSGRATVQEAIGDTTIPNTYGHHFGNALGGWGALGTGFDIAPGFAQVRNAGAAAPTVPFLLGAGGLKPSLAPATNPVTGPTEGLFQFGSPSNPASHSMLLDGTAYTPAAQKQLYIWLLTGRVADPADTANWPSNAWLGGDSDYPRTAFPQLD
ncbi:MAG: hypothetical protein HY823_00490 [Acidobacteria bacterium]|nr:hypothetical protein [Acidobacteriota bacterium]